MKENIKSGSLLLASTIKSYAKRLRLLKVNRELLVFFVFLCISGIFWLLQAFQESTTVLIDYKIRIVNIPKKLVITSDIPESINVTVAGRGYDLMTFATEKNKQNLVIDYEEIERTSSALIIDNATLKRHISKIMPGAINFVSVSPAQISLSYSNGEKKRVPVIYAGDVTTGSQYSLCNIKIAPDSVDIYAPADIYKSVNVIHTEKIDFENIEHSHSCKLALRPQSGVKVIPDSVDVMFNIELFSEKSISVPISTINVPSGTLIHTFPSKVNVTSRVSAKKFNSIVADSFKIVVDYNSITPETKKCKLILLKQPAEVANTKLSPESVEYIIEHQ